MPKNNPLRIIIDTNIWVSFVISDKLNLLDNLLFQNKVVLLFSEELIDEIKLTFEKPKLKKFIKNKSSIEDMFSKFEDFIELVDIETEVNVCRDRDDNFLLSLAKDGNANVLITGDNDLLVLNPYEEIEIITIKDFFNKIH